MSAKKEDVDKKEEETVKSKKSKKKTDEKKTKPKKNTKPIVEGDVKTLYDLVNEHDELSYFDMIVSLTRNGYFEQFCEEEIKFHNGEYIKPSLTENEFKKIIGG